MSIATLRITTILAAGFMTVSPAMALESTTTSSTPSAAMSTNTSATDTATASTGANKNAAPAPMNNNPNTASASAPTPSQASTGKELQTSSSEIVGNINIATVALAYGMDDDASKHIDAARQAISAFNSEMSASGTKASMTESKVSYKTSKGTQDYWIPVINDSFVVRSINGDHLASKNPDMDVSDAQVVDYKMILDTKIADDQLAKAQNALSQKEYNVAMIALQNISQGAITETMVEDKPLEAARDNLILAKELLEEKDYRGASYALKHANKELAKVEKNNPGAAGNAHIKDMQSQINKLEASITKKDPSMLSKAEGKIDGWIQDVKTKI